MTNQSIPPLTYDRLKNAVAGNDAAVRIRAKLYPAGGQGTKVFPPTHSGGIYAWEMRRIESGSDPVPTVLLDSVQSQANRMEECLLNAYWESDENRRLNLPLIQVDFSHHFPDIGAVSSLEAPHRIADAIFRDSVFPADSPYAVKGKETRFRDSEIGQNYAQANIKDANALFQNCPHALVFGVWDSTGSEGGLGHKFQRALVSEIVGVNATEGYGAGSRKDPLGIRKIDIWEKKDNPDEWTADENQASLDKNGNPIKFKKSNSKTQGKPSEINHSNIAPNFPQVKKDGYIRLANKEYRPNDILPQGVTIDYALQTSVLSFPALRKLRFPDKDNANNHERNDAARTVLASLALVATALQREEGFDLRSRCQLVAEEEAEYEIVAANGVINSYSLNSEEALQIYRKAVQEAKQINLKWTEELITLKPQQRLVKLVQLSREAQMEETDDS